MTEAMDGLLVALRTALLYFHADTLTGALVFLVLHLAVGQVLSVAVVRGIQAVLAHDRDERVDRLTAAFVAQLARVLVWLFVLTAYAHLIPALDRLATALLAGVSIASVVFALAAQSTLANLVAGLSLVFYKPFRLGDQLQLTAPTGMETGTVEQMSLGHTTLRASDGRRVVISNSTILNQVMVNLGPARSRRRLVVPFTVTPSVDSQRVCALLTDLAKASADVVEVVSCSVTDIKADATGLALTVWTHDAEAAERAKGELLDAIRSTLGRGGLE